MRPSCRGRTKRCITVNRSRFARRGSVKANSFPSLLVFQLSSLQQKLQSTSLVCQSSTEHNLQLQLSLQQQQTMLTESTARVSELEESQSRLQRQVS